MVWVVEVIPHTVLTPPSNDFIRRVSPTGVQYREGESMTVPGLPDHTWVYVERKEDSGFAVCDLGL